MTDQQDANNNSELRKRAEQKLEESLSNTEDFSLEDAKRLIHELHVHQIELELQNEELRVTQLALETSRRKYIDLYEFSPIGLLTLDNNEHIQEANLTFVTMLRTDREKLTKRNLSDFIAPSAQNTYHFFFQALHRTQQPQQCEINLRSPKQAPLVVRLDGMVLVQADTQITYRIAVSDITVRHQSELEIRRLYVAEQEARTQAERSALRIADLQRLTAALSEAVTPEQVGDVIIRQGLALFGAHLGSLAFLTDDQQGLEFSHLAGFPSDVIQKYRHISLSDPLPLSDAVRTQQPVWLGNLQAYQEQYPQLIASVQAITGTQAIACIPLSVNGRKIGGMGLGFAQPQLFSEDDKTFILALAGQCVLALDRAQQGLQMASTQERQWLSRELHDSVTQTLFSAALMAESLPRIWEGNPEYARKQTNQIVLLTRGAMAEMRTLLIELRPETIVRTKLDVLLKQLGAAAQARDVFQLILELEEIREEIPAAVHTAIYRIAQESITNVVKHSRATQLRIHLHCEPEQITLQVEDNGQGFDIEQISGGLGQTTLRERAKAIDATLLIDSEPGKGTRITLVWKRPISVNT